MNARPVFGIPTAAQSNGPRWLSERAPKHGIGFLAFDGSDPIRLAHVPEAQ